MFGFAIGAAAVVAFAVLGVQRRRVATLAYSQTDLIRTRGVGMAGVVASMNHLGPLAA